MTVALTLRAGPGAPDRERSSPRPYDGPMPTYEKFSSDASTRDPKADEWLQLLVGDWNLIADLTRADLVLWVKRDGEGVVVAHCRPTTAATAYYEDPVDARCTPEECGDLMALLDGGDPTGRVTEVERDGRIAERSLVPIRHEGTTVGVLAVERVLPTSAPSGASLRMQSLGHRMLDMVAAGGFPILGAPIPPRRGAPRAVDGVVELDEQGVVRWASPNALSAFHRFGVVGDMEGTTLAEMTTDLIQSRTIVDESLPLVLMGRAAWRCDMQARGGTLSLRAVPLTADGVRSGAVVLVRDVTELRRRERELITKDATIREVHHRVKNNLQTVAALLRLQARRMTSDEARDALNEAMRRVSTIALVHEALLQGSEEAVFFDDVIDRALRLAVDVASATVRRHGSQPLAGADQVEVRTQKIGRVGTIRAEEATPLALVVTELVTNAIEHGLSQRGGTLTVRSERKGSRLVIHIEDDGEGIATRTPSGLGTNIAQTLVQGELGGTLSWEPIAEGGTRATIEIYLDPVSV